MLNRTSSSGLRRCPLKPRKERNESLALGDRYRFHLRMRAEPLQNVLDVCSNCLHAQKQFLADAARIGARGYEPQHLELTLGQRYRILDYSQQLRGQRLRGQRRPGGAATAEICRMASRSPASAARAGDGKPRMALSFRTGHRFHAK